MERWDRMGARGVQMYTAQQPEQPTYTESKCGRCGGEARNGNGHESGGRFVCLAVGEPPRARGDERRATRAEA